MKPIYVTQPQLPPLNEYIEYLVRIWDSKWLTNNGEFHRELEHELAKFLGVKYLSLFSNGTLALISALQVLKITGEVITTPYSFVATTHALWWNNIKPVFVDVEPNFCTIDPNKIEIAITPNTTAILPVHVYGNPCDVNKIESIAATYGLKTIYDAAHAFGVKYQNNSILNYGDLSVLSFHATKIFNTFEGGAIVCHDEKIKKRIDYLKNFGFSGETTVIAPGINAKMNEIQAAFGLLQLKYFENNVLKRSKIIKLYKELLHGVQGLAFLSIRESTEYNNAYFPIFITKEYKMSRDELYEKLKLNNVFGRRYFYPLISSFSTYSGLPSSKTENLLVANRIAYEVLCLPIYSDLTEEEILKIANLIIE